MTKYKYSTLELREAVATSHSVTEVMQKLGIKLAGGSHYHLSNRIKKEGIDTSHFLGQASNRGKISPNKLTADEILIRLPEGRFRPKATQLRRALAERGVPYRCAECGISEWQQKKLTLDVDHKDGDWLNNELKNLRFLCPNCHSQTPNFGNRKRIRGGSRTHNISPT